MEKFIRIGDEISWRGSWGTQPPKLARVVHIEKTRAPGEKHGNSVNEISVAEKYCAVFSLDNGHWAFGDAIALVEDDPQVI